MKTQRSIYQLVVLPFLFFSGLTNAATIITWNLTNVPTKSLNSPADPISSSYASSDYSYVSASDMGLNGLLWSEAHSAGTDTALNLVNWQVNGTPSLPANYLSFTLDIGANDTITIDSLSISHYRNGAGAPANGTWEYSLDNIDFHAIGTSEFDLKLQGPYTEVDALDGHSPLTIDNISSGLIYFRFSANNGGGHTGNLHINGITLSGTVSASSIPEPTSTLLLTGSFMLGIFTRRKKI